ncbi:MAG: hypothetical protein ACO3EG_08335 [Chitinophagaceae bacterium]
MKKLMIAVALATLVTGCASVKEVEVRKTAAQPTWYAECEQRGKEGWFWAREGFVYSCGLGVSKYAQASELQADAFAVDSFARRIGSRVNSLTKVEFIDEKKTTHSRVETNTGNTLIQNQLESKKYQYIYNGQYYTYIRLKMTEETFNALKNKVN